MSVCLIGIIMKPELNGCVAYLGAWDKERERWAVRTPDGNVLKLQPRNFVCVAGMTYTYEKPATQPEGDASTLFKLGDSVSIAGLTKRKELNGLWGACQACVSPGTGRIEIITSSGESVHVKPANLVQTTLVAGMSVKLFGCCLFSK